MPDDWPKDAAQVRDECEQFPQMTWPNRDILYWVDRATAAEALAAAAEKCGSLRVLRWVEGYCPCCGALRGNCVCFGGQFSNPDGTVHSVACSPKDHGRDGYGFD